MISRNILLSGDDMVKKLTEVPFKKKQARTGHPSTYADDLKLLHELKVQQLEMEMQNEELHANQLDLEALKKRHAELFEFAPNGYFALTPGGTIREVNLTGAEMFGLKKSMLTHQLFVNFIHSNDREIFKICLFNLIETRDYQVFKVRLFRSDGYQLYVRIALTITEGTRDDQILLAMTDVTMIRQIEEVQAFLLGCSWAKEGKDFFHSLAKYLSKSLGMDCVSIDKFLDDNHQAQTVALYCDGHHKDNVRYLIQGSALSNVIEQKSFCFPHDVRTLFPHDVTFQKIGAESYTGVTLWGSEGIPIGLIMVIGRKPLMDSRLTEMVLKQVSIRAAAELEHRQLEEAIMQSRDDLEVLVRERTAELEKSNAQLKNEINIRQQHEQSLVDSHQHLRQLTQRIDAIAEEERTRIAREIHDELGHLLTTLKYNMDELSNESNWNTQTVKSELGDMISMVDSLIVSVRKIATELRPGILDHLGLFPAIEWQIRQFRLRTKICCTFTPSPLDVSFDKNETIIIYRLLQEILTNITRHSKARHVKVNLGKEGGYFILKVTDNGVGFKPDERNKAKSLGLMGMQERALSIGGELYIESTVGKGTTITFILPKINIDSTMAEI